MSSSSYQSANEVPLICKCGLPVARKQSWTSRNPGRRFVTCKFYNPATGMNGCNTFAFVDEPQIEWQRAVINNLLLEKKLLERHVDHLKLQVCNNEDQKSNLIRDNQKMKVKVGKLEAALKGKKNSKPNLLVAVVLGVLIGASMMVFYVKN